MNRVEVALQRLRLRALAALIGSGSRWVNAKPEAICAISSGTL
jgi:hypothetical protein